MKELTKEEMLNINGGNWVTEAAKDVVKAIAKVSIKAAYHRVKNDYEVEKKMRGK